MASLSPYPRLQFFDMDGKPLAGGKLYTYIAGTTTAQNSYTASNGATPQANPVVLDAGGFVPDGGLWLGPTAYKLMLNDSAGNTIWTVDNVAGSGAGGSGVISVDTIADLRLLTGGAADVVVVQGYWAVGDQGGGVFTWLSANTGDANDPNEMGIFIKSTATATGRWKRVFDGAIDIRWFGAVPGGTAAHNDAAIGYADYYAKNAGLLLKMTSGVYQINATDAALAEIVNRIYMEPLAILYWTTDSHTIIRPIIDENDRQEHFRCPAVTKVARLVCEYIRPEWFSAVDLSYAINAVYIKGTGNINGTVRLSSGEHQYIATSLFTSVYGLRIVGEKLPERSGNGLLYGSYIYQTTGGITFDKCNGMRIENVGFVGGSGAALIITDSPDIVLDNVIGVVTAGAASVFSITGCDNARLSNMSSYNGPRGFVLSITNSVVSNITAYGHTTMGVECQNTETLHFYNVAMNNIRMTGSNPACTNDCGFRFNNGTATTATNHIENVTVSGLVGYGVSPVLSVEGPVSGSATIKNCHVRGLSGKWLTGGTLVYLNGNYDLSTCKFGDAYEIGDGINWDGFYNALIAKGNINMATGLKVLGLYADGSTSVASSIYAPADYLPWATRNTASPVTTFAGPVVDLARIGSIAAYGGVTAQGTVYGANFDLSLLACTVATDVGTVAESIFYASKMGRTITLHGMIRVGTGGGSYYEITVPAGYEWDTFYTSISSGHFYWLAGLYVQSGAVASNGWIKNHPSTNTKFLVWRPSFTPATGDEFYVNIQYRSAT